METIKINNKTIRPIKDWTLFKDISYAANNFDGHESVLAKLRDKNPSTITVIVDILHYSLYNKKQYVKKTKHEISSRYLELLYKHFFNEFGQEEGHEIYRQWLTKYRTIWNKENRKKEIDDYIIAAELEPRYEQKILKKFKNLDRLKQPRTETTRERYYNLPEPLNRIDYRNPYDNIFIWTENGKKYCLRGGSGSSGQREINSKFIYGYALINQWRPVPSHLYIYNDHNQLRHIKTFRSLTVPRYCIGDNYFLPHDMSDKILKGVNFMEWKNFTKAEKIYIKPANDTEVL